MDFRFPIPDTLTLSVVIPVYDERATIQEILRRVRAVPIKTQIIVVDDCSRDGTREILTQAGEKQRRRPEGHFSRTKPGERGCVSTGFRHTTGDDRRSCRTPISSTIPSNIRT